MHQHISEDYVKKIICKKLKICLKCEIALDKISALIVGPTSLENQVKVQQLAGYFGSSEGDPLGSQGLAAYVVVPVWFTV